MDKAAVKMSTWNGRNLTLAGQVYLTKSVLSSQLVYLFMVFKPPLEVIVDCVYSYQTSIGLASGQVPRRSQGTLLPSSVNPRYRIRGTNV
jgi:hypothetical protein